MTGFYYNSPDWTCDIAPSRAAANFPLSDLAALRTPSHSSATRLLGRLMPRHKTEAATSDQTCHSGSSAHGTASMKIRIGTRLSTVVAKVKSQPTHCTLCGLTLRSSPHSLHLAGDLFRSLPHLLTEGVARV